MGRVSGGFLRRTLGSSFLKYFTVGVVGTSVDWTIFYMLAIILGFYYQFSLVFSFFMGAATNYLLNKLFTFRCRSRRIARQFAAFFSIALVCLLLSMALMYLFVDVSGAQKMPSRVLTTFLMLFVGYVLQKKITFNMRFFS